jgi:hypothetical protein
VLHIPFFHRAKQKELRLRTMPGLCYIFDAVTSYVKLDDEVTSLFTSSLCRVVALV